MVNALFRLWMQARIALVELAGVVVLTIAAAQFHTAAALGVVGVALLAKSVEWDLKRGSS